MTSEEMIALMSASNTVRDNVLIALVIVVVAMAFILPVVVAIMVVRVNASMTQFILAFAGRGVQANEASSRNIESQTQVIRGQSNTLEAINKTGQATGAAVSAMGNNLSIGLEILKLLGVDVGDLAKHASSPTAGTKQKVDEMADKAEQASPTQAAMLAAATPATPAISPHEPGDEIKVIVSGTVPATPT